MKNSAESQSQPLTAEEAAEKYSITPVDVAIIGAGPAGYSAAINAANRGRSVMMLSGDYKNSYLYKSSLVENMPGLPGKSGAELLEAFRDHALSAGAVEVRAQVLMIMPFPTDDGSSLFQIASGNTLLSARSCILATGVSAFKPYPGEEKFLGRGVSYCATCDGMLYRGKNVCVIGKSSDAVEEAIHLAKIGCHVHFFASASDLKKWAGGLPENTFEEITAATSFSIEGEQTVTALLADGVRVPADGVFIVRTSISPDNLVPGIELENGYIRVSRNQESSVPGVFAAGDCTGKPLQIAKALGEGLVAALSADSFLSAQEARPH